MTPLGFLFFHRILLTDQKITKSMETMTNELTVIPGTIGMMGGWVCLNLNLSKTQ